MQSESTPRSASPAQSESLTFDPPRLTSYDCALLRYEKYANRFKRIFSAPKDMPIFYLPGNRDVVSLYPHSNPSQPCWSSDPLD